MKKTGHNIFCIFILFFAALSCAGGPGAVLAGEGSFLHGGKLIEALSEKTGRDYGRVAVLTFVPSDSFSANTYGDFLADNFIVSFKKENSKFRIYERSRLNLLLEENELRLTGIIGKKKARKIGELAPIDYIVTASYHVMGRNALVNGRIVDVVSGEIVSVFKYKVAIKPEKEEKPVNDICGNTSKFIDSLRRDITSKGKIDKLVKAAVTVPFDNKCGRVHLKIISLFKHHNKYPPLYQEFLLNTLAKIKNPSEDLRASYITRYFHSDGQIDDREWRVSLICLSRSRHRYMPGYIAQMFHSIALKEAQLALQKRRIDEVMAMAQRGEIGLPVRASFAGVFIKTADGLWRYSRGKDNRLLIYLFEKWGREGGGYSPAARFDRLIGAYKKERRADRKAKLFNFIYRYAGEMKKEKRNGTDIYLFAKYLKREMEKAGKKERMRKRHFDRFTDPKNGFFCPMMDTYRDRNGRRDRVSFMLRNNIRCTMCPSGSKMTALLRSKKVRDQKEALGYLVLMEKGAGVYEKDVQKLFRRYEINKDPQRAGVMKLCIEVLGNVGPDKKSRDMIFRYAMRGWKEGKGAAVKNARLFVPRFIKVLRKGSYYEKLSAVIILGEMKSRAGKALPYLKKLKGKTKNQRLKGEIKKAILRIR